jgi:hypothetical protein
MNIKRLAETPDEAEEKAQGEGGFAVCAFWDRTMFSVRVAETPLGWVHVPEGMMLDGFVSLFGSEAVEAWQKGGLLVRDRHDRLLEADKPIAWEWASPVGILLSTTDQSLRRLLKETGSAPGVLAELDGVWNAIRTVEDSSVLGTLINLDDILIGLLGMLREEYRRIFRTDPLARRPLSQRLREYSQSEVEKNLGSQVSVGWSGSKRDDRDGVEQLFDGFVMRDYEDQHGVYLPNRNSLASFNDIAEELEETILAGSILPGDRIMIVVERNPKDAVPAPLLSVPSETSRVSLTEPVVDSWEVRAKRMIAKLAEKAGPSLSLNDIAEIRSLQEVEDPDG